MKRGRKKGLEPVEKRIRFKKSTFLLWRKLKAELGFGQDDDFAQYLIRVRELESMKKWTSMDADSDRVEEQDVSTVLETDSPGNPLYTFDPSEDPQPSCSGTNQAIEKYEHLLAPPYEVKTTDNGSAYIFRHLNLGWCSAEFDRQHVLSGITDQKKFVAHLLNSHNQWCSTCRMAPSLAASSLAQEKSEFAAATPELKIPTSWESKKWFEDLHASSNMSLTSFMLHLLLIYSHWHSIPLPGEKRLCKKKVDGNYNELDTEQDTIKKRRIVMKKFDAWAALKSGLSGEGTAEAEAMVLGQQSRKSAAEDQLASLLDDQHQELSQVGAVGNKEQEGLAGDFTRGVKQEIDDDVSSEARQLVEQPVRPLKLTNAVTGEVANLVELPGPVDVQLKREHESKPSSVAEGGAQVMAQPVPWEEQQMECCHGVTKGDVEMLRQPEAKTDEVNNVEQPVSGVLRGIQGKAMDEVGSVADDKNHGAQSDSDVGEDETNSLEDSPEGSASVEMMTSDMSEVASLTGDDVESDEDEDVDLDSFESDSESGGSTREIYVDNVKNDPDWTSDSEFVISDLDEYEESESSDDEEKVTVPCKICGVKKTKSSLDQHLAAHKRSTHCTYCDFTVDVAIKKDLKQCSIVMGHHRRDKHPTHFTKYLCDECGKGFALPSSLSHHYFVAHNRGNLTLRRHQCHQCDESFSSYSLRKSHEAKKHPQNLPCTFEGCDRVFATKERRKHHIKIVHIRDFKYSCNYEGCSTKCISRTGLQRHIEETHQQLRKFQCDFEDCGKTFLNRYHLKIHKRIHSDEKPLKCPHCDYGARQRNALNWHLKKTHGEEGGAPASDGGVTKPRYRQGRKRKQRSEEADEDGKKSRMRRGGKRKQRLEEADEDGKKSGMRQGRKRKQCLEEADEDGKKSGMRQGQKRKQCLEEADEDGKKSRMRRGRKTKERLEEADKDGKKSQKGRGRKKEAVE